MYKETINLIQLSTEKKEISVKTKELENRSGELFQAIHLADKYANVIFRMPKFQHAEIKNLATVQQALKNQIIFWQGEVKPQLGKCISDLRTFYSFYNTVYTFINKKIDSISDVKKFFLTYLNNVVKAGDKVSRTIKTTESNIITFNKQIENNNDALSSINSLIERLISKNGTKLVSLNTALKELESEIKNLEKSLLASGLVTGFSIFAIIIGAVLIATGVGAGIGTAVIVGGVVSTAVSGGLVGKYNPELIRKRTERKEKFTEIKGINKDTTHLTNIKTNFTELLTMGADVVQVFNNLHSGWSMIATILAKVVDSVRDMHGDVKKDDISMLELNLDLLNEEFKTLCENAKKYEEGFSLPIQDQVQSGVPSNLIPNLEAPFIPADVFCEIRNLNNEYIIL